MSEFSPTSCYYETGEPCHTAKYLWPEVLKVVRKSGAKKVFDLGCGNGALVRQLVDSGYQAQGVDPSESGIAKGRRAHPDLPIDLGSAYDNLATRYGTFDCVVSLEVVEHLYFPRKYAACIHELLRPGGWVIVSTPYHSYLKNLFLALFGKMDRHFTALWDHGHIKFWSVKTLSRLFEERGFVRQQVIRAGRVPPLAKSMILIFLKPREVPCQKH